MNRGETFKFVQALIMAIASSILPYGASAQSTAQVDWKSRFLTEAPLEWKKLEAAVGQWEVNGQVVFINLQHSSDGTVKTIEKRGETKAFYDTGIHGMRREFRLLPDIGAIAVTGSNDQYDFTVQADEKQPMHIREYFPLVGTDSGGEHWMKILNFGHELVAEQLWDTRLSDLIHGNGGELKSATPIEVNGKTMVRLDFDCVFGNSHKPYPASAIVDPDFHWALISWEVHYAIGTTKGTVEYHTDIPDVAFPKHYMEQYITLSGQFGGSATYNFEKPKPSHHEAKEFTLEDFGLEPPKSGVQQPQQTAPPPTTTSAADQSGSSSASSSGVSTPSDNQKSLLGISSTYLAISAGGLGIFFYVLFLLSRRKGMAE